jgi:hypothetical protein
MSDCISATNECDETWDEGEMSEHLPTLNALQKVVDLRRGYDCNTNGKEYLERRSQGMIPNPEPIPSYPLESYGELSRIEWDHGFEWYSYYHRRAMIRSEGGRDSLLEVW